MKKKIIKILTSSFTTVFLLSYLMLLTTLLTIEQKNIGLYEAKVKYIDNFFVYLNFGIFKVPSIGGYLLFWLLFINLICVLIFRFKWNLKNIGLILTHFGMVLLLIGCFLVFHFSYEGELTFLEGQEKDFITIPYSYNLFIYKNIELIKKITINKDNIYKKICDNIEYLKVNKIKTDIFNNKVECTIQIKFKNSNKLKNISLKLNEPFKIEKKNVNYTFTLKNNIKKLEFNVKLIQFIKETYIGTHIPKHFESKIAIRNKDKFFQTSITMNNPLWYKQYIFYQTGYDFDRKLNKYISTLTVVYNPFRLMPYISSFIIFLGLITHFLYKILKRNIENK